MDHPASTMNLVRIISDEEHEYTGLTLRIGWRTHQIAALEAELAPIQCAFEHFEWEYTQRIGHITADLQALRATVQRVEDRTTRVHARLVADPTGVLGELFDRDELREIGEMFGIDVPDEWFAAARASDRRSGRGWDWASHSSSEEEELIRELQRSNRRRLPEEQALEMRACYRDLARRFHPDLADNDDERGLRQEIMLRINHAWQCQDLDALRALDQELDQMLPGWSASHLAHRLAWARRECERLDVQAEALVDRIQQLRASETFPLWFNSTLGSTVIAQRANALRPELEREEARLEDAKLAFKQALAYYAAAVA
jgi:hypothetical protein